MKIGIHFRKDMFSERWVDYCKENNIEYKLVNAYDSDIISQLNDCDAFMWHFGNDSKDSLFANQLLFSLQTAGKAVFPDFNTSWHCDDKVGQKYLLEAIGAPFVVSYVFYSKEDALKWIQQTTFPKVFKLRKGAASNNVQLVKNEKQAKALIIKAFGRGFQSSNPIMNFNEAFRKYNKGTGDFRTIIAAFIRMFIPVTSSPKQKGYVYFQEFISNNTFDIRIIVTGNKAFAIKRMVRENDFRASGSGNVVYDKNQIDKRCIEIAFHVNELLKMQSIAYDFIFDQKDKGATPLITEISFGYTVKPYDLCPGYWDKELTWHEESFNPQYWQIENFINHITKG